MFSNWESCFSCVRELGQREENDLFAGYGADVVMQAQNLDAGGVFDHRLHDWPRRFDQLRSNLLEQIPSSLRRKRLGQLPFGRSQHALEADDEEIANQMGVNVFRSSPHVLLLEAADPVANGGFDFSLRFHNDLDGSYPGSGTCELARRNPLVFVDLELLPRQL